MEKEFFLSGYCRNMDDSRMVVVVTADGALLEADCDYGTCPHAPNCTIAKQIGEMINK